MLDIFFRICTLIYRIFIAYNLRAENKDLYLASLMKKGKKYRTWFITALRSWGAFYYKLRVNRNL